MPKESFVEVDETDLIPPPPDPFFEPDPISRVGNSPLNKTHFASKEGAKHVKEILEKGFGPGFKIRGFSIDVGANVPQRLIEIVAVPSGKTGVFTAGLILDVLKLRGEERAIEVVRIDFERDAPAFSDED